MINLKKALLACSILLFASCGNEKENAPRAMPVKVAAPTFQKLAEWDEYTGRFRARESVEIRARVSGYLDEIKFVDGQAVKAGDVLFVVDQRPFKIALEQAAARHELAKKDYERSKNLAAKKAISQQELDIAFEKFRDAKAGLEQAQLELEFTEVKSPIDGRASRNLIDKGNLITGGAAGATLLTTVVSQNPIDFYFEASEQDVLKYTRLNEAGTRESSRTLKRPVFLKLQDEQQFVHQGEIDFIDNALDPSTGTLQARAVFQNPKDEFLPGIFARIRLAGSGEYEATLVPDAVVGTNQTIKFVYVVGKDSLLEIRPVVLGPLYENGLRIIRSGLSKTDKVVMAGITMLRPGMPVKPEPYVPDNSNAGTEKK